MQDGRAPGPVAAMISSITRYTAWLSGAGQGGATQLLKDDGVVTASPIRKLGNQKFLIHSSIEEYKT
jgi:hypothetical protein